MADQAPSSSVRKPAVQVNEPEAGPVFEPYKSPAGGWGALRAVAQALREQSVLLKGSEDAAVDEPAGRLRLPRDAHGRIRGILARLSSARTARKPSPLNSQSER